MDKKTQQEHNNQQNELPPKINILSTLNKIENGIKGETVEMLYYGKIYDFLITEVLTNQNSGEVAFHLGSHYLGKTRIITKDYSDPEVDYRDPEVYNQLLKKHLEYKEKE